MEQEIRAKNGKVIIKMHGDNVSVEVWRGKDRLITVYPNNTEVDVDYNPNLDVQETENGFRVSVE
jgi:hypothetical protein